MSWGTVAYLFFPTGFTVVSRYLSSHNFLPRYFFEPLLLLPSSSKCLRPNERGEKSRLQCSLNRTVPISANYPTPFSPLSSPSCQSRNPLEPASFPLAGATSGRLPRSASTTALSSPTNPIALVGRRSLLIRLIHQPGVERLSLRFFILTMDQSKV